MPTYEYACTGCGNQWEEIQKISESPLDTCPKCAQKTAKRQISGGNFILKGGGWYADLYSSTGNKGGSSAKSDAASSSSSPSSSSSSTASKSESAAPAASASPAPSKT